MTAIQLRSRHLDSAGAGINALTVEVYATDGDGLPTGAAVASTTTDANGVWEFLTATGLLHSTRYCVKITNGAEVMWLDGSDMIQAEELAVRTKLILPDGNALTASITAILNTLLTTQGDLLYASAANTPARLAKGTAGQVLEMNPGATAPQYSTHPTAHNVAANVHGLGASVNVLGNRNAAGQFIQHGTANIVVSNTVSGQATVTFPVAFTTLLTIVACLKTAAGQWSVNFASESTTGATFYIEEVGGTNRSGTMVVHWVAIGT